MSTMPITPKPLEPQPVAQPAPATQTATFTPQAPEMGATPAPITATYTPTLAASGETPAPKPVQEDKNSLGVPTFSLASYKPITPEAGTAPAPANPQEVPANTPEPLANPVDSANKLASSVKTDVTPTSAQPKSEASKKATAAMDESSADLYTQGMDFAKRMMAGDDPTVRRQFNSWLQDFGNYAQASKDELMMRLRQDPEFQPGSGEGNALMGMLSRDLGGNVSQMMAQMSVESAKMIGDWNKWGVDKSLEVRKLLDQERINTLTEQLTARQITAADQGIELNKVQIAQGLQNYASGDIDRQIKETYGMTMADIAAKAAQQGVDMNTLTIDNAAMDNFLKRTYGVQMTEAQLEATRTSILASKANLLSSVKAYQGLADLIMQNMPGVYVDANALAASDPSRATALSSRMKTVSQLVEQGDAGGAKKEMTAIAGQFYAELGYKSPQEAQAAYSQFDFSTDAWKARTENTTAALKQTRDYLAQGNKDAARTALDQYFAASGLDPAKGVTLNDVNDMRKAQSTAANPLPPLNSLAGQDLGSLGKDLMLFKQDKEAKENVVDHAMSTLPNEYHVNPQEETLARAWLTKMFFGGYLTEDPNGGVAISPGSTVVPPWQDDTTSMYFTTWPVASWAEDGTTTVLDRGGQPMDANHDQNTPANLLAKEQWQNKVYTAYLANTPADKRLSREAWYYATQGGMQSPDPARVPATVPTTPSGSGQAGAGPIVTRSDIASKGAVEIKDGKIQADGKALDPSALTSVEWSAIANNQDSMSKLIQAGIVKDAVVPTFKGTTAAKAWLADNGLSATSTSSNGQDLVWSGNKPIVYMNGHFYRLEKGIDEPQGFNMVATDLATNKLVNIS